MIEHVPVLTDEVVGFLVRGPGWYLDATVGGGGHAASLLEALPAEARLLGLDRDPAALRRAQGRLDRYGDRVRLVHASFDQLGEVLRSERLGSLAGALFDLGLSSLQLGDDSRGFSFSREAPLDLRFDPSRVELDKEHELEVEILSGGRPLYEPSSRQRLRLDPPPFVDVRLRRI